MENSERVKALFKKLYDAHRWSQSHPAIAYPDQYKAVCDAVEGWCDKFESMGYDRRFALCIFTFGTDYQIAYDIYCKVEDAETTQLTTYDQL